MRSCSSACRLLVCIAWLLAVAGIVPSGARGATINVTTTQQRVTGGPGCSLQEAIYAAEFHAAIAINGINPDGSDNFVSTGCLPGTGSDTVVLPTNAVFFMNRIVDDAHNPFGPTATPIVFSDITIEANGARLIWTGTRNARAFAVGSASITYGGSTYAGTGKLTIRNAYINSFRMKGGTGANGGGGGMGAGGAIYVKDGALIIDSSTFDNNTAVGGAGTSRGGYVGGGGGGLSGNGGNPASLDGEDGGGGGGGSRGDGGPGGFSDISAGGGGGGGTVTSASVDAVGGDVPGVLGGGAGGGTGFCLTSGNDGSDGSGPGGGGGGGESFRPFTPCLGGGNGGKGNYGGGGGGGGGESGSGGNGGFGGGGGSSAPNSDTGFGPNGGNGGFGGGGGASPGGPFSGGPGHGGLFGGNADTFDGGGGAALGGAIFNDGGGVRILNSTFTGNSVYRGNSGGGSADSGSDAGGAIFMLNGSLTVKNSTIVGNSGTGSGSGIMVYQQGNTPTSFTLLNTIISGNGGLNECSIQAGGTVTSAGFAGNLIYGDDPLNPCPGVVSNANLALGLLQDNGGYTPTMAIIKGSPAWGTADGPSSLALDQRGFPRPSEDGHGFDIGAFELCTPAHPAVSPFPCTTPAITQGAVLTMQVTPFIGGTTSPPVGQTNYPLGSIAPIQATPAVNWAFNAWTPNVTDPSNPSTTIIMNQDQTVMASFVPVAPCGNTLTGRGTASSTYSPARVGLVWGSVGGLDHWDVLRGTALAGPYTKIASVPNSATSYLDNNSLQDGQTYDYTLNGIDANGNLMCWSNQKAIFVP